MELRWIERERGYEDTPDGGRDKARVVLQYRERQGPMGEGWWGDWTDVPVVLGILTSGYPRRP